MQKKIKTSLIEIVAYLLICLSVTWVFTSMLLLMEGTFIGCIVFIAASAAAAFGGYKLLRYEETLEAQRTDYVKRYDYIVLLVFASIFALAALGSCANRTTPNAINFIPQAIDAIILGWSSTARKNRYQAEEIERINDDTQS